MEDLPTSTGRRPPSRLSKFLSGLRPDPRHYQIATLSTLLLYGIFRLGVPVRPVVAFTLLATALTGQALLTRLFRLPHFDPRSPLISGLSLCLLLRTTSPAAAAFAAAVAIGGKFLIRPRGKHLFNPANLGLTVTVLVTGQAWISPGQWGSTALFALLAAGAGSLVVYRSARSDITWAFLGSYGGILLVRALWLGDPLVIPLHRLENGALLIFAFFMISDPKTTPDSRSGRLAYGAIVAAVGAAVELGLHQSSGPIWALAACSPVVLLLDRLLPAGRYRWPGAAIAGSFTITPRPVPGKERTPCLDPAETPSV